MIQIFENKDCMIGMKELPDKYFDIIITSPPYNLGNTHHTGNKKFNPYDDDMPEYDYQMWQIDVLNECSRVLKNNGSMFYNHKNRIKNGLQITPYSWILNTYFFLKQELVWFNRSQNFDSCRFYPMTERVYWLVNSPFDLLFDNNIKHHDLFDWQPVGTDGKHKRAFPLEMVQDILRCFPTGLKVLDPFAGSGTVPVACEDMGYEYVGYELDKDYYDAATKRLENFRKQLKLDLTI